jgi:hypothetical protein
MRLNQLVETTRAWRDIGKLHTAWIRLPEGADSFLEVVVWIKHAGNRIEE